MDISEINDINTLKAMAFDEIRTKATAEANLSVITARIQQLEIETTDNKSKPETTETTRK